MRLRDIATKLKVSSSTVSRALNPATEHLISPTVRKRIQTFAAKGGYVHNRTAQELVQGRSHTIGVVLSTVFNSIFFADLVPKVLAGVYAALHTDVRYSCKLIVLPRGSSLNEHDQHIIRTGVDGLLISSICDFSADTLEKWAEQLHARWRRPVVGLNLKGTPKSGLNIVSFSNLDAAREAMHHLIRKGHQKIGLIWADNGSSDILERVTAYKEALKDHAMPVRPELMIQGNFVAEGGYQAALTLCREAGKRPTALFCLNDEMAMGAMRAIKALRLRCPEDVAVMGFDGLEFGEFLEPRLSTVRQPADELAKAGTQLLLDLIEGKQKGPIRWTLPARLILRDSA